MVAPRSAGDDRQALVRTWTDDPIDSGLPGEIVEQSGSAVYPKHPVQFAPADITIDQERLVTGLAEGNREVGGYE